ncbi:spore germination protein [Brevibacillus fulvus]|uniref:Spore germination protein KA n=1 Tax=Brevibacillus fulvus TaxID=1125967 RepID=A0A938Y1W6_9BACL|nr:spore germination protein [Brevibacillus fulvus]MBM7590097.1 spore germination protein KA [Brevibacillus fulvus]
MRNWFRTVRNQRKKKHNIPSQPKDITLEITDERIETELAHSKQVLQEIFRDCSDVVFREIMVNETTKGLLVFIDGIVNTDQIHENLMRPLLIHFSETFNESQPADLKERQISLAQVTSAKQYAQLVEGILTGSVALLVNGYDKALLFNVVGGTRRGVEEPATEATIRGPREGFTESLRTNTALLRYRLKSPRLKTIAYKIGEHTQTNVALAYIDGLADPRVIAEVRNRLERIKIDGILESSYIEELIEDDPFSIFPQVQNTERPDTVAAHLLEGRFAIFIDNTPFVLVGPVTAWLMLQASEDYYQDIYAGSFIRLLRLFFLGIALFMPALYVAVTTFHQDMIPTTLLLSIAAARESIPFPAIVEALIMEISFEALREAGVRLPKTVGQAVSILGALVIGQAAVQAGIVSAPMVIIVSVTGIASFTVPRYSFGIAIRLLRFPLMLLGATFGLYGIVIGTMCIVLHLAKLRSFGVPYLSGIAPFSWKAQKDLLIRSPWWRMITRPPLLYDRERKRMSTDLKPSPVKQEGETE